MTIFESQLEQGRLYAKLPIFQQRLRFALEGIGAMGMLAPKAYLSLSFGKQSIVLAHMLFGIDRNLPMYFLASGESFIIHNYDEVISEFTKRWPINLHIVKRDRVFDGNNSDWQESRDRGQFDLQEMCNPKDWDGWYWGLSRDESNARFYSLAKKFDGQTHQSIFRYANGKYRCCPLMNWRLLDLSAYIDKYDIPVLKQYKKFGLQTRTTARVTKRTAELHGVYSIKQTNVEAFNKLTARFPELKSYT